MRVTFKAVASTLVLQALLEDEQRLSVVIMDGDEDNASRLKVCRVKPDIDTLLP
jgi:hypothetical protein